MELQSSSKQKMFEEEVDAILKNASCTHLMCLTTFRFEPYGSLELEFKIKETNELFADAFILNILLRRIQKINNTGYNYTLYVNYNRRGYSVYLEILFRYFEIYLKNINSWDFDEKNTFKFDNKILTVWKYKGKISNIFTSVRDVNDNILVYNVKWEFIDNMEDYKIARDVVNIYFSEIFKFQNHHYRMNRLIPFRKKIKEQLARWQQELWKPPNGHFAKKYAIENAYYQ